MFHAITPKTVTQKSHSNKKRYTSRLLKGGALLEEMRVLVRNWTNNVPWEQQRHWIIEENILGKKTRARALDVLREAFVPRFLKGDPPEAWRILQQLEDRDVAVEILRPIYYWLTARSEPLLYDFVMDKVLAKSSSMDLSVMVDETVVWIAGKLSECRQSWSQSVTIRVARGLLAALRDFGILEGASRKQIAPVYLPIEPFAYIAFVLHTLDSSGERLIAHPDWKLFLMEPPVVEMLFLDAHQNQLLNYEAAGKIYRIEFPTHNLEEMADVIAGRRA
jgi:hypothetical protein